MSSVICLFSELSACLAFDPSNDLRIIKCELVAGVQAVCRCEIGHVAIAYRRFMLFRPGKEGSQTYLELRPLHGNW